mmetsp:Transcript_23436/g.49890  ORF Transcript_23436/g.49890 Transcript_23436/m.49890 type:complete len:163 (+) Transcript_23436:321-809(+)|eukprot:CAMPEP_0201119554 /NCGR_PEP_ID=MMETSP0850-20130426/3666_1 /ASSEMBLY_ACC=CAM_ASM_000622 /TAXON_ID=183588 /ORGANISM="Pseudo-nitzschia fraudulenta, Strain WWA7" /LENGTH=162 /DNA_ID=CAMNT_0047385291 /DNA_START=111 /DNA_END=599 /DNA_ORIENTATION=+
MATCVCVFHPEGSSGVSGSITMSQTQEDAPTVLEGTIRGLTPGQRHGMALCTYGDVRDTSSSCGAIFNPFGKTHGAPSDDAGLKMAGDLGNITADAAGVATIKVDDSGIKIFGPHSVIGRSVVICAGADDEARGGHENSISTGNAGPRIAFGVVGLANPTSA